VLVEAIANIAPCWMNKAVYVGATGIHNLSSLLSHSTARVQSQAAFILAHLARIDECKGQVIQLGGVHLLTRILELGVKVDLFERIHPEDVNLLRVIGKGVAGQVWKAEWRGKIVAIKKFSAENISFDQASFDREAAIMSVCQHQNVVSGLGACTDPEALFIALRYYDRGSLGGIIHSKAKLPYVVRLRVAMDVVEGMSYLHSLGVIHRDLKVCVWLVVFAFLCLLNSLTLSKALQLSLSLSLA
jgi:predicted Ser/Thr protein kinase